VPLFQRLANIDDIDFSSIYYLGSRLIREIVSNKDLFKKYNNPINKLFYNIEKKYSGGNIGIQQAYILYRE
jgi:hypothetical protein